jgi:hypothetical protein
MKKQDIKVQELKTQGYKVIQERYVGLNNRRYRVIVMEAPDGSTISINNRGGVGGLGSAMTNRI